jgi:hypothetical protein
MHGESKSTKNTEYRELRVLPDAFSFQLNHKANDSSTSTQATAWQKLWQQELPENPAQKEPIRTTWIPQAMRNLTEVLGGENQNQGSRLNITLTNFVIKRVKITRRGDLSTFTLTTSDGQKTECNTHEQVCTRSNSLLIQDFNTQAQTENSPRPLLVKKDRCLLSSEEIVCPNIQIRIHNLHTPTKCGQKIGLAKLRLSNRQHYFGNVTDQIRVTTDLEQILRSTHGKSDTDSKRQFLSVSVIPKPAKQNGNGQRTDTDTLHGNSSSHKSDDINTGTTTTQATTSP